MAHSSLRFGIGRFTTEAEIDFVVKHLIVTVKKLRDMRQVYGLSCKIHFPDCYFSAHCGRWSRRGSISIPSIGLSHSTSSWRVSAIEVQYQPLDNLLRSMISGLVCNMHPTSKKGHGPGWLLK